MRGSQQIYTQGSQDWFRTVQLLKALSKADPPLLTAVNSGRPGPSLTLVCLPAAPHQTGHLLGLHRLSEGIHKPEPQHLVNYHMFLRV